MAAIVVVGFVLLVLAVLAPPRVAPMWWRDLTRPIRRRVRPNRYRSWY